MTLEKTVKLHGLRVIGIYHLTVTPAKWPFNAILQVGRNAKRWMV